MGGPVRVSMLTGSPYGSVADDPPTISDCRVRVVGHATHRRRTACLSGGRATFATVSFVPLQGPATLTVTHPPRDSEVEFTGGPGGARDRVVRLPMRGAIPVLSRALRADDAHPSVGLLGGATVLAIKLVAAGRIRVTESGDAWRGGPAAPSDDTDAVRRLAQARAFDGVDAGGGRGPDPGPARRRGRHDDPHPAAGRSRSAGRPGYVPPASTGRRRPARRRVVSLRVEAPAEQLADGLLTVVLQVHDRDDPGHVTDAATLWEGSGHGFSRRARLSAGTELRRAAVAWPTLDRLLREPVPDRIVLDRRRARPTCSSTAWVRCSRSASTSSGRAGCGPSSSRGLRSSQVRGDEPADDRPVRPGGDVRVRLAAGAGRRVR